MSRRIDWTSSAFTGEDRPTGHHVKGHLLESGRWFWWINDKRGAYVAGGFADSQSAAKGDAHKGIERAVNAPESRMEITS